MGKNLAFVTRRVLNKGKEARTGPFHGISWVTGKYETCTFLFLSNISAVVFYFILFGCEDSTARL